MGTAIIACLIFAAPGAPTAPHPAPPEIIDAAQRVLADDAYTLEQTSLYSLYFWQWIGDRVRDMWNWLDDKLGVGDFLRHMSPATLRLILYVCLAVLVAILAYNGYVLYKTRRVAVESFVTIGPAQSLTAPQLVQEAQRLAAEGNFVDASRRLFLAALVLLEDKRGGRLRQGLTNSEYLQSFRTPWVRDNLRVFVDLINWKWYRSQNFNSDDFARCRLAYDTISARLDQMGDGE
jgi:hypothetical protein